MKKTRIICIIVIVCVIVIGCMTDKVMKKFMSYESEAPKYNDTVSPSKQYSCFVDEIGRDYEIRIMKGDELSYVDSERYRMRDRFYLAWSPNEDVLWVYSGDIGLYYYHIENDTWSKGGYIKGIGYKFDVPLYVKENTGAGYREE
ncbi:MAG: hypothetical protein Ta2B_17760 [Termitinemataceae bacterium]|nr:MAG: hypothetical protein Ta2B_17760 [Termitinemataceae bacterium]